jgi:hypothetical protein
MTIINDDSSVVNKLKASLTDDARVIIYDHHMLIVQGTGVKIIKLILSLTLRENKLKCFSLSSFFSLI